MATTPHSIYFFDPSYEYATTTFCDPHDDAHQLWTYNTTSNMLYSAVDRGRCLSLVPNTANLNLDSECASAKVDGGVLFNGVVRDAYMLSRTSKVCTEVLQEYGRWGDMQFHTYSNIVTSYECVTEKETPWLRASQLDQQQWIWDNETGAIVNPRSGSCLQIGGAMDQQCSTLKSTNKVYLAPSPYPAYLYPCDRGCDP